MIIVKPDLLSEKKVHCNCHLFRLRLQRVSSCKKSHPKMEAGSWTSLKSLDPKCFLICLYISTYEMTRLRKKLNIPNGPKLQVICMMSMHLIYILKALCSLTALTSALSATNTKLNVSHRSKKL